jgi:transcriptional regulator with XRE-family HTH domain
LVPRHRFAEVLHASRVLAGFTQQELAAKAALPFWRISRLERGMIRVHADDIVRLARVLGWNRGTPRVAQFLGVTLDDPDGSGTPRD